MRSITGFFKSVDELSDKFNICFINGLWIIISPVQGSMVNNSITLTNNSQAGSDLGKYSSTEKGQVVISGFLYRER